MSSDFYRAFEDKHRGSRELIKNRLRVYLPFLEPLQETYKFCRAVDLGCGLRTSFLDVGAHDRGAFGGEAQRCCLADPLCGARDERDLPQQPHRIPFRRHHPRSAATW